MLSDHHKGNDLSRWTLQYLLFLAFSLSRCFFLSGHLRLCLCRRKGHVRFSRHGTPLILALCPSSSQGLLNLHPYPTCIPWEHVRWLTWHIPQSKHRMGLSRILNIAEHDFSYFSIIYVSWNNNISDAELSRPPKGDRFELLVLPERSEGGISVYPSSLTHKYQTLISKNKSSHDTPLLSRDDGWNTHSWSKPSRNPCKSRQSHLNEWNFLSVSLNSQPLFYQCW